MRLIGKLVPICFLALLAAGGSLRAQTTDDFFNPGALQEIRLEIFPADWQKLKANFLDNTYYPCNLQWKYQGKYKIIENVGIRSRGTGSRSGVKPGLRVDFNRYEAGQLFLGLKSFVLRNNIQDPSMLRERIAMRFFQWMEIPGSREAHTRLYVNDEYIGLYSMVESVDKDFLSRNYGENDGYLYKYDYPVDAQPYYFGYRGSDPALYSPLPFQPETHETDPDPKPLEAMIRVINQATDSEFPTRIAEYLDLKYLMTYIAIENFLAELDGFLGEWGMNNYYLYRFEKKNLSTIIPWDRSLSFSNYFTHGIWHNISNVSADKQNVLVRRALAIPELRNTYLETLNRCTRIAGKSGQYLEQELNFEFNQVRQAAYEDPNKQCYDSQGNMKPCTNADFDASIETLRNFMRNRPNYILSAVPKEITAVSQRPYSFPDRGGISMETAGLGSGTTVGYARILPANGSTTPGGLAIFGLRQNSVLVTEAGVPASPLVREGRIYVEVGGGVNTGVAIANPNAQAASISFLFVDSSGKEAGSGTVTVPANGQLARFVNEAPFGGGNLSTGTLTLRSSLPVGIRSLRGLLNERSEFLITTLPVAELTASVGEMVILPHFADGGGWKTQVILVNPSETTISGTVQFVGQGSASAAGRPVTVTIGGQTADTFNYSIPPGSSRALQTAGSASEVLSGSVRVQPFSAQATPSVMEVFSFRRSGITVSEAGVSATKAGAAFRLYAEVSGNLLGGEAGAIQTGLAIANPSGSSANVSLDLTYLSGKSTGLKASVTVPANGQVAQFLGQLPGFSSLPNSFQGILRVSAAAGSGVSVVGLRGRQNERGDFLITTTPPSEEGVKAGNSEMLFPQLADGGGYTTQLILFSGSSGQSAAGDLRFLSQGGQPLGLVLW